MFKHSPSFTVAPEHHTLIDPTWVAERLASLPKAAHKGRAGCMPLTIVHRSGISEGRCPPSRRSATRPRCTALRARRVGERDDHALGKNEPRQDQHGRPWVGARQTETEGEYEVSGTTAGDRP